MQAKLKHDALSGDLEDKIADAKAEGSLLAREEMVRTQSTTL